MKRNLVGEVQEMTFCPSDFDGETEMWQAIADFEALLIKTRREFSVRTDGYCIMIQYGYDRDNDYGNHIPMWVDPDEYEDFRFWKENQEQGDQTED